MKAATVASQGAEIKISDVPVPQPSDEEILVKSIYAPVNPVSVTPRKLIATALTDYSDSYMIQTGILVVDWPFVPGCDAGGVVVKAGKNAISSLGKPFKEGDKVFGCTKLGTKGHSTFEEFVSYTVNEKSNFTHNVQFLMDPRFTFAVPKSLELVQASTLGVALCVRLSQILIDTISLHQDCFAWYLSRAECPSSLT